MSDTTTQTVQSLRPKKLNDYIGQAKVVQNLKMFISAVKKRGNPTEHILFYGPSGTGKTTLSNIVANELGSEIKIILRSSKMLKFNLSDEAAMSIAKRSRGTPRIAVRILNRVRDVRDMSEDSNIDLKKLDDLFSMMELDDLGLSNIDRKYLNVLGKKFKNNPLGVETIASSLSEDKKTIEEFVEPYLLQIGFIKKTTRGRILTEDALNHIGIKVRKSDSNQEKLI